MKSKKSIFSGILLLLFFAIVTWWAVPGDEISRGKGRQQADQNKRIYGEPLPWEEVKKIFPRYTTAYLVDVETGLRFQVERRGGTYHADIQPLTADDTAVLSEIYGGRWSWRRRAVVVEVGMKRIAASIHGMPHGSGKIRGNNFSGHFCVHFLNSRVHTSAKIDTAHQMMVWKAAGRPEEPYLKAEPREVLGLVIIALNQGDGSLASLGLSPSEAGIWAGIQCLVGKMPGISLDRIVLNKKEDNTERKKYHIRLSLYYPGEKGKRVVNGDVVIYKDRSAGRWLLEGEGLKTLLEKGKGDS